MNPRFDGQVALVTGAGKGLGRAYALWLAERGAAVVVNNRTRAGAEPSARRVAGEIEAAGGAAMVSEHAVDDERAVADMVRDASAWRGRLDILICNAAIVEYQPITAVTMECFRRVVDANFWGTVYPVYRCLPHMLGAGYGRIVLTSSQAGLYGQAESAAYCASKAAMIGLARSIAIDVGSADVRVNIVVPAAYTRMSESAIGAERAEALSPFKAAPVVAWLASRACDRSGLILHTAAGRVARARIMENASVQLEGEDLAACWPALDATDSLFEADVARTAGYRLMRR
ncbi:MAG: SDR family NAD(P)-dependent oxidoreductase [Gammaproteobacteria bacterium]